MIYDAHTGWREVIAENNISPYEIDDGIDLGDDDDIRPTKRRVFATDKEPTEYKLWMRGLWRGTLYPTSVKIENNNCHLTMEDGQTQIIPCNKIRNLKLVKTGGHSGHRVPSTANSIISKRNL